MKDQLTHPNAYKWFKCEFESEKKVKSKLNDDDDNIVNP